MTTMVGLIVASVRLSHNDYYLTARNLKLCNNLYLLSARGK